MHTQTDTAQVIISGGGEYVFTMKGNQPLLHTACKKLPWKDVPAHRVTTIGHGRAVTRTIKVIDAPPGSPSPAPPNWPRSAAP